MTGTLLAPNLPCPAWCATHDTEAGVCLSATTAVNMPDPAPWMIGQLAVTVGADTHDGVTALLTIDGHGGNTTLDGAEQFALAILDQIRAARAARFGLLERAS